MASMNDLDPDLRAMIERLYPESAADGVPTAYTDTTATIDMPPHLCVRALEADLDAGGGSCVLVPTLIDRDGVLDINQGTGADATLNAWLDGKIAQFSAGSRTEMQRRCVDLVKQLFSE